jgi:peptidyl-prolyl cis-trans isomerase A (cyclophilin A)
MSKPRGWSILAGAIGAWLIVSGCNAATDEQKPAQTPTPEQKAAAQTSQQGTPVASQEGAATAAPAGNPLMNPKDPMFQEQAPATYKAKFETSKGAFVIEVTRAWSPNGADRFYQLVQAGFFNDCRFFRAVKDFMVQFGLNGDPKVTTAWRQATILDDPASASTQSNKRGYITFAKTGQPNSRTTQVFINFKDNTFLDRQGFTPFGTVVEGLDTVVDKLYTGYGDAAPGGKGPNQGEIMMSGNDYLKSGFPDLDYITKATIVK